MKTLQPFSTYLLLAFFSLFFELNAHPPGPLPGSFYENPFPVRNWLTAVDTIPSPGQTCDAAPLLCQGFDNIPGTLSAINIQQIFPGCPGNVLNNTSWYGFVAGTSTISLLVTPSNCQGLNGQFGMQGGIYSGCNGAAMAVQCPCIDGPFILEANNFVPGNTYYLVLDGCAGDVCDFTVEVLSGSTAPPDAFQTSINGQTVIPGTGNYTGQYIATGGDFFQWSIEPPDAGAFIGPATGDVVTVEWQEPAGQASAQLCVKAFSICGDSAAVCQTILIDSIPVIPVYDAAIGAAGNFVPLTDSLNGLCFGDSLFLTGYTLLDGDTVTNDGDFVYQWTFDGTATAEGKNIAHVFNTPGFHAVEMTVTATPGNQAEAPPLQNIYVVKTPDVTVTGVPANPICMGTPIVLTAETAPDTIFIPDSLLITESFPDGLLIPDGSGVPLEIPLILTGSTPGSTLDSPDNLRICVNMEHSWMRDLEIKLTCPNGQSAILHNHPGQTGNEVMVGQPLENDEITPLPGIGFDYCWTNDAPNPTWIQYANANVPNTLPAGDYSSFQSLNNLTGCPLDGVWTYSFKDLWAIDNGFVFSVSLMAEVADTHFIEIIASPQWQPDPSITFYSPDSIVAAPDSSVVYLLDVTDNLGCGYQLEFPVEVLPADSPACLPCDSLTVDAGEDVIIDCTGNLPATVTGTATLEGNFMAYQWTYNGAVVSTTQTVDLSLPGEYIFTATNQASGCTASDTLNFTENTTPPIADAGPDGAITCTEPYLLDGSASSTGPDFIYAWIGPSGDTISQQITAEATVPGVYTLLVTDVSNACTALDQAFVFDNITLNNLIVVTTPDSCNLSNGTATAIIAPSSLAITYLWSTGDTTASISGLAAGDYSLAVQTLDGCEQTRDFTVDSILCTSTWNRLPELTDVVISPNPNHGRFTVQFVLGEMTELAFSLHDAPGRKVALLSPAKSFTAGTHSLFFEQPHVPEGTYFLEIRSPAGRGAWKLVTTK